MGEEGWGEGRNTEGAVDLDALDAGGLISCGLGPAGHGG